MENISCADELKLARRSLIMVLQWRTMFYEKVFLAPDQQEEIFDAIGDRYPRAVKNRFFRRVNDLCGVYLTRPEVPTSSELSGFIDLLSGNLNKMEKLLKKALSFNQPIISFGNPVVEIENSFMSYADDGLNDLRAKIITEASHIKFCLRNLGNMLLEYNETASYDKRNGRPLADSDNFTENLLKIYTDCFGVTVTSNDKTFSEVLSILLYAAGITIDRFSDQTRRVRHALDKTSEKK